MELWSLLRDIVVLLSACLLFGSVFSRLGQSPLVGYLIAGMVLGGPGSIDAVGSEHEIEAIAELGVALLLFSLGLEFSVERLKQLGFKPLLGGVIQVVLTIAVAAIASRAMGLKVNESVAVGAMVSLSSTAVVLRILLERSEIEMPHGRNSLAVLLTQDMAVVPLAILMTVLGGEGSSGEIIGQIIKLVVSASFLIVGLWLLNRFAVMILGTLTLYRNRELAVIFAVVTGLGAAWAAHEFGISPALGAFVAGMLLGSSVFATQIRADVSSLRVVLLTLFFGAAGMVADPIWIAKNWYLVGAVSIILTIGKLVIIWGIFQALGHSSRVASATGLCLAQIGEFAFVLGSIGRTSEVVSEELYALVVSVTIVSFVLSAFMVPAAPWFGNRIARLLGGQNESSSKVKSNELEPDVIIVGFGPAGQIAARPLMDQGLVTTVIDLNQDGIKRAKLLGFHGEIGDAMQLDVLEHAKVHSAKVVVITIPHQASSMMVLANVKQLAPLASVFVRSRYQSHTEEYICSGAHFVAGDEEQVGASLASRLEAWRIHELRRPSVPQSDLDDANRGSESVA